MGVNLTGGLDTKTDPKTMVPGSLTDLENCEIIKANTFKKRSGNTEEPAIELDGSALTGGEGLATHDDNQLLRVKDGTLYARSESGSRWIEQGYVSRVKSSTQKISSRNTQSKTVSYEHIEHNGYIVAGYNERLIVFDAETGVVLDDYAESGMSVSHSKCTVYNDRIYIFYYRLTDVRAQYFDTTDPASGFSGETIIINNSGSGIFDVTVDDSIGILFGFSADDTPEIDFEWRDEDLTQLGSPYGPQTITASTTGSADHIRSLKILAGGADEWYALYHAGVDDSYKYLVVDDNLSVTKSYTTIEAIQNSSGLITGFYNGSTMDVYYANEIDGNARTWEIKTAEVDTSGVQTSGSSIFEQAVPFSDPFEYDGNRYIFIGTLKNSATGVDALDSDLLGNVFLWDITNDRIEARFFDNNVDLAMGELQSPQKVSNPSTGVYQIFVELTAYFELFNYELAKVDFNNYECHHAQLGDETIFAGGAIRSYDGSTVTEQNFHIQPKLLEDLSLQTTGGSLDAAVYQYALIWEWIDNNGRIVRSAPFFFTADHSGSGTSTNATENILVNTLGGFTDKVGTQLVVYRTEGNGSVFYRTADYTNDTETGIFNDLNNGFTDTRSDSSLIANARDQLYTSGGILSNIVPPAAQRISVFKDRIFLSKTHEPGKVWYSQISEDGIAVRFSDSLIMSVDYRGQGVEGLGVVDDKLIALFKNRYYYTYGDGPNTTGFGGSFAPFELASNDTGVQDGKSIVETPDGLMYRSAKGIYLIDSGLNSSYIGAQVEDIIDGQTITSAVVVPQKNRVRFTTESGDMVEYDFFFRKWYTHTGLDAYDAVFLGNEYYLLRNTGGLVFKEDDSVFEDDGTDYLMKIETGWISLASLVGFQRIYSLFFVGERKDSCSFKVSVAYDHNDTYVHSTTINLDTALDDGAAGYYPFRLEVPTKIQKCEAIRVKIEEVSPSSTDESFTITGMGMKFGIKRGFAKIRSTQTSGVS